MFFFLIFRTFQKMPLDTLVCFLFMNEKHDYQFLTLTDDRWPESTITFRRTLGDHAEVKIKARKVYENYFLILKGTQDEVTAEYSRCLREKNEGRLAKVICIQVIHQSKVV